MTGQSHRNANLVAKMTFLYTWAMGVFIGMQLDLCWSQFQGEVSSSSSEEPQKNWGDVKVLPTEL